MRGWKIVCCMFVTGCAAPVRSGLEPVDDFDRLQLMVRDITVHAHLAPVAAAPTPPPEPASRPAYAPGGLSAGGALRFELGAGIAPYDDGHEPFELLPVDRPGFSDALMRMSWTRPITPGMRVVTTAAATRLQDLTVFETLQDAEVAWVTLGLHFSF
ncbi:MAG: hypothetical protein GY711_34470 [bacterium]|nr:hypothetical protein [bacterium]